MLLEYMDKQRPLLANLGSKQLVSTGSTIRLESALVYQSCVERCEDLHAGVMVQKDLTVIHDNFIHGQSQRGNQQVLITAAAENVHRQHL